MARTNNSDQYAISLFPMFNILICTLGILIFILGALAALALGVGKSVTIIVDGGDGRENRIASTISAHGKIPHFFEWDGFRLTALPGLESVTFKEDISGIETFEETYTYIEAEIDSSDIADLVQVIGESKESDYVVLLVRTSGFSTLYEVRGYFELKGISLGYEPVMQGWHLRVVD